MDGYVVDPVIELFLTKALTAWTEKVQAKIDLPITELFLRVNTIEKSNAELKGRRDMMHITLTAIGVILGGTVTLVLKHFLHL